MLIEPYQKKVINCDGCGKWRRVGDLINGDDWTECVYCCCDADLERCKKDRKYDLDYKKKD